jgi:hypothetical protein
MYKRLFWRSFVGEVHVFGLWSLVLGLRSLVFGLRSLVLGLWS